MFASAIKFETGVIGYDYESTNITESLVFSLAVLGLTLGPIAAGLCQIVGEAGVGYGAVGEDSPAGEHVQIHGGRRQQAE